MNEAYWRYGVISLLLLAAVGRIYCETRYPTTYQEPQRSTKELFQRRGLVYILDLLFGGPIVLQLLGYQLLPMQLAPTVDTVVRGFGLALCVVAGILSFWPRYLRQQTWSFPMTSPDKIVQHQLFTAGPYKYVRHPFYAACLLAVVAMELALASYLVLILPPALAIIVALGVRKEEQQLENVYGGQFRAYQQRSWRLVPLVY